MNFNETNQVTPNCRQCSIRAKSRIPGMPLEIDEQAFIQGIANGEFSPVFHPIVDRSGRPVYFELLMRWARRFDFANQSVIGPNLFCEYAERLGVSVDLWQFALLRAEQFYHAMHAQCSQFGITPPGVAVNISPHDVTNPVVSASMHAIVDRVANLHADEFCPISLEITESIAKTTAGEFYDCLAQLQDHQVKIAIDDFGTGYSSLSRLRQLNADYLKVDKAFISKAIGNKCNQLLLTKIVEIGHLVGAKVVLEGIETEQQLEVAMGAGGDLFQGFYFSTPLPQDRALLWMERTLQQLDTPAPNFGSVESLLVLANG